MTEATERGDSGRRRFRKEPRAAVLSDPTAVKPTFVVDRPGQYVLQLIVNDGQVDSAPDQVIINTQNSKPVANAGPDQTVPLSLRAFLDGSKSSDVDGDQLNYHWSLVSQPAGSTATLDNATTASPSFIPDKAGSYTVQLIVNDGKVDSDPDTVVISTQNSKPVANAGPDQTVQVGDTVQLDGSSSTDADGDPLTYRWSFTSKPVESSAAFSDPAVQKPTFVADKVGLYVVQLIVHDGKEGSDPDTASITVKVVPPANHPPVAQAGTDQDVSAGTTVHLDGGQSSDPDGDTLSFSWQFSLKPASSQAVLQNADTATPSFVADVAGPYSIQLTVSDGKGGSASDIVDVTATVGNHPPTITSTAVTTALVGQAYSYDVDATDPDAGDVLTFSLPTAPAGMTINPTTGLIQWAPTAAQVGNNNVTVRGQDSGGLFATQSFTVTVKATNAAPVAVAGLLGAPNLPACIPPPGGLVSWYPGDGNPTDIIGPNSPTSTIGSPQFVPGKVGQGIQFDGSSGLVVPNNPAINFGRTDSFSIDFWVRVEGRTGVSDNLIVDKKTDLPLIRGYSLSALLPPLSPSGTTRFNITIQEDGSRNIYGQVTTSSVPLGEFHHVVGVVDRTQQTIAIYLDGVLEQELSIAHVGEIAGGAQLSIGHHNVSPQSPLIGTVDELEIFNRALSQSEIQSVFLAGSAGKCKVRVGETVNLDGTQSTDPDSDPLSYHWTLLAKPDGSTAALSDAHAAQPTFVVDKPGTYRVQLIVNDGIADSAPAEISIGVLDANRPSIALDDSYTVKLGETLTVPAPGVIANDHDADGDPLTATKLTNPAHGTLSFNGNGSFAYTPDASVHGPGNTAHTVIATIYPNGAPKEFAINPATNRLYVSDIFGNNVAVIDGTSNKIVAVVQVPHSYVEDVAINPVTNRIYASGTQLSNYIAGGGTPNADEVTVINGVTNTVMTEIAVGHQPQDLTVNPSTNRIYVANVDDNTVSVIDGATNTVIATVPVAQKPQQIGVNSNTNRIYVLSTVDDAVTVIDGATNTLMTTVPVGDEPRALLVDADLNLVSVANYAGDSVSVIDGNTNAVIATVPVGDGPQAITINALTNRIYVANGLSNAVSVIDGATQAVTATVPVGTNPRAVSVNPLTDRVYTADFNSQTVSVVHVGDHFTYKVNDGQLDSNAATVTVVVEPGELAPAE